MTFPLGPVIFPSGRMVHPGIAETGEAGKPAGPVGKMTGEAGQTSEISGREAREDRAIPLTRPGTTG
jgi:hypothetical protein